MQPTFHKQISLFRMHTCLPGHYRFVSVTIFQLVALENQGCTSDSVGAVQAEYVPKTSFLSSSPQISLGGEVEMH
jgi:hypothetical protein